MSLYLGDSVICGEIDNTRRNRVTGRLLLRGLNPPLQLTLTGNCASDLAGRFVRFAASSSGLREEFDLPWFSTSQVGPTECFTAARRARIVPPDASEFFARTGSDAPEPEDAWRRCLHLAWFGQNGRVVVELIDPIFEVVEEEIFFDSENRERDEAFADSFGDNVPNENEVKRRLKRESNGRESIRLRDLMRSPEALPRPDELNDHASEQAARLILAELALYAVAVDMCEHCSPQQLYRLLVERILHEGEMVPDLLGSRTVQHHSTRSFCKLCAADVGF